MYQTETVRPALPDPETAPELFEGVLTRRVSAFIIDVVIMGAMILGFSLVGLVAGLLTFGLAWLALVFVVPVTILLYYTATLGSSRRATVGMQFMDIVLTPTRGQPLDGWMAIIHAAIFWLTTWISWPISLLFALFTPRRQMIHDLVVGTLMVRRSPMVRHWRGQSDRGY
ncbi:MAG: RDD family protein [Candidatus Devosia phytovorans]|uniref:RDD family protein n=1 Tax=Candidatus Devosia phytovorans TaxID=3121372 RepID=A0AAJ5VZT0_9HYPH|nr:RDD family protein [Devosia sp.]WEK06499.1 MAG: RDD family protein [Devosia sp.]